MHSLTEYKIINEEHKLQPKPSDLNKQLKGLFLKFYFFLSERKIKNLILNCKSFFLVVLQVASDSQIYGGSKYKSVEEFIEEINKLCVRSDNISLLIFKHHPRTEAITTIIFYKQNIEKYKVEDRVLYFMILS